MGDQAPTQSSHLPEETHDDRAFDTMLRLLIMMEGELQTKEAIIEVLMEGRSKDTVLLNKLNKLLGVRETDPFSALKRDGVYSHQKWSELFMNENERGHAVLSDSSRYLSACSSLRAISVARLQNQRYSEAYDMLQKTVKSYRKLKVKYTKERRKTAVHPQPLAPATEVNDVTPINGMAACEELEREKERGRELEVKVEELTSKMADEQKQTRSIEKQMRDEIRRLDRELREEREHSRRNHCRLLITTRRSEQATVKQG